MDPISAAGIGLSVTSLALQLFAGCIKGYQIFLDAAEMPENFEHLRVRMRIEQIRLLNWGEKVGLLGEILDAPSMTLQLNRDLINEILLEIQRLFRACLKIDQKFDHLVPSSSKDGSVANAATLSLGQRSQKATNVLLAKTLKVLEKTAQVPRRLQWATVKQNEFEKLIEKLISYNDSVVSLLDRASVDQLQEMQVQMGLTMLQLSSKIDDLKQLSLAMQVKTDASTHTSYSYRSNSTTLSIAASQSAVSTSVSALATFKAHQTTIELHTSNATLRQVNRELVTIADSSATRSQATYQNQQVWIEWKEWEPDQQLPNWEVMIQDRVRKLAVLLGLEDKPKEFRAPTCLGFFDDREEDTARYGFIYSRPPASLGSAAPTSLLDLIGAEHLVKPSLTQRILLAQVLAQSLLYLHSVNWLHKNFRSDNIVFFVPPDQSPDYSHPIISGFDYARPDLPEEQTEKPSEHISHDIYRHPDAVTNPSSRSKKSWDIYSLGVVLVEIALWQSVSDIVTIHEGQKGARAKLRKVREMLLEGQFLERLAGTAGDKYREVVRSCLAGGSELGIGKGESESDPNIGADLLQVFSVDVVGKLASIKL